MAGKQLCEKASKSIFDKCKEGSLFYQGWRVWFNELIDKLTYNVALTPRRMMLAKPNQPVSGCISVCKLDVGFVPSYDMSDIPSKYDWSRFLVIGELKENPNMNNSTTTRFDLGRYAEEVLYDQDTRRFVSGFTLCGYLMRTWEFDRLGAIESKSFDINTNGQKFVYFVLGFLLMDGESLDDDPEIIKKSSQRLITINRNAQSERFKAHLEEDPETLFVIKDSWQDAERDQEGELLKKATEADVQIVVHNVRGGLEAGKCLWSTSKSSNACTDTHVAWKNSQHTNSEARKRSRAESDTAMPLALEGCIRGHKSLYEADILYRDISINNLMIDHNDSSRPSLILTTLLKIFMAIGALEGGREHSFMHDLGSFFWSDRDLIAVKAYLILDETRSFSLAMANFTTDCQPLTEWVSELRKVVFPDGRRWVDEELGLYGDMI
ncbi:hypothetical protein F4679DRAFT_597010 [Xylaria curta]|nr:hypothetical protein F4679DRAFT_597010 [Xylaria curta]